MRSRFEADVQSNCGDTVGSCGLAHVSGCSFLAPVICAPSLFAISRPTCLICRVREEAGANQADMLLSRQQFPIAGFRIEGLLLRGIGG